MQEKEINHYPINSEPPIEKNKTKHKYIVIVLLTLIDDSILLCHFCDVRIRSNAEVTGGLEKQKANILKR